MPERAILPQGGHQHIVNPFLRHRLVFVNFFEHHLPLALQFFLREGAVADHIRDQFDGYRQMLGQHARIEVRGLTIGKGVDAPADILDLFRQRISRTAFGALEKHMLEKMRQAMFLRRLIRGPGIRPHADGHGFHLRHFIGEQQRAIGQAEGMNLFHFVKQANLTVPGGTRRPLNKQKMCRSYCIWAEIRIANCGLRD